MNKQYPIVVSPVGIAAYAWISKVDQGHKYSDGKFKVTLVLDKDDPELATLRSTILAFGKEEFGNDDFKLPFKDGDKSDKPEFQGKTLVVAKSKFPPGCIDAKRQELPEDVWPYSGDLIKFSASLYPYETGGTTGVSLQLRGVQLLDKRNKGNDSASDFGEEDGYDAFEGKDDGDVDPDAATDF